MVIALPVFICCVITSVNHFVFGFDLHKIWSGFYWSCGGFVSVTVEGPISGVAQSKTRSAHFVSLSPCQNFLAGCSLR